jgi:hypothetical protein
MDGFESLRIPQTTNLLAAKENKLAEMVEWAMGGQIKTRLSTQRDKSLACFKGG